jgi:hypothetical protein
MFDRRGRRAPVPVLSVAVTAGLLGLAGLAGCSGGSHAATGGTTGITVSNKSGVFNAQQLKGALLTRINGDGPVSAPNAGSYSSLPGVQAAAAQMNGVTVTPSQCMPATVLQGAVLDTGALGTAPAAVVNFRVVTNGVSEVLATPPSQAVAAALGKAIPAGCTHYTASTGGRTFQYTVKQDWAQGIGKKPARVLDISLAGQKVPASVWSVVFQGAGFIGAVSVDGPNASEAAVRELGEQAYQYAAKTLS